MVILIFTGMMGNYSKFLNLTPVHQSAGFDESAGDTSNLPQVFDHKMLAAAPVQSQGLTPELFHSDDSPSDADLFGYSDI
jgi:hypothetical protein